MHSFASIFTCFELRFKAFEIFNFVSKILFVTSTPLAEKMIIYLHSDKLRGNYNLTEAF